MEKMGKDTQPIINLNLSYPIYQTKSYKVLLLALIVPFVLFCFIDYYLLIYNRLLSIQVACDYLCVSLKLSYRNIKC